MPGTDRVTLITAMFMHARLGLHIIGNMVFLWAFGPEIEDAMGRFHYLVFYLLGGIVAMLAQVVGSGYSRIPCLGASGAIAAVMGAFIVMYPRDRIRSLLWIVIFVRITYIPAVLLIGFWFLMQLINVGLVANVKTGGVAFADVAGRISKSSEQDRLLSVAAETASALDPLNLGDARRPALTALLQALAEAGERDAAVQMAKRFEAPNAGFSKILVTELTRAGDWQSALEVTRDPSLSKERMDLSIAILGALKPAEQSAIEAVAREAAAASDTTWNRRWSLKGLIETLVRIQARAVAIGIARAQNELDGNRAAALIDCAGFILKTDTGMAESLAHEAWDSALKISAAYTRKGILGEALLIRAKAGGADAGIEAARHLIADEDRAHVLTQAVLFYGEVKNAERARAMTTEALDAIRGMPNSYARRDPAGGLLTACLAGGMLAEALTVAREVLEPDGRCQVLLAVLTKRLKDFQFDFLEEIADEVFRGVAEDGSPYNRNRNLSALLKLADESDLGPEWVWGRIKNTPEPSRRRELFASAVTPGRFQLIASLEDVGDRDAILSAYALKFEGEQGKTVGKIIDAGVRDEALQKLCASRIRSGELADARKLVEEVQSSELKAGILLDIASGYLKQGNSYVAVELCKRIARSATPGAVEAAIELLVECREAPEARAAVREIATSLGPRTSQNRDFALGLWALARTNPLEETIEYLTAGEPPEPVVPRTWFARIFSKPAKREPKSPIEIASSLGSSSVRSRALASLSIAYARADQADLAIEAAERIEDAAARRSVFTEAARLSAGPTFEKMLGCAVDSARALKDEFYRKRALAELLPLAAKSPEFTRAVALAREGAGSDVELAQHLVSLIPLRIETAGPPSVPEIVSEAQSLFSKQPTWQRDAGMTSLVLALCSAGLYREALRIAGEAEPIGARTELLLGAIAPLSSAPSGVWALAAARALMEQFQGKPDYERKRQTLAVAKSLRAAGLHADALSILSEISAAPGTKEYVNSVAPALAESGFFDEAIALAESAPEPSGKAEALTSLIPFAVANDRDVVTKIADRVLMALKAPDTYWRHSAISRLVQELDNAGVYDSAFKAVELSDPLDLSVANLTHVKDLLQRGNRKNAWSVALFMLTPAANIRNSWERDPILEDLTKTLLQAGFQPDLLASHPITAPIIVKVRLASNDVASALNITGGITNTEALRSLSMDFAHAGHFEEALKIAERIPLELRDPTTVSLVTSMAQAGAIARAAEIAADIADPFQRSTALRDIALIEVKSDALPGALNLARLIPLAAARIQALAQIATAHADRNHPDRAETVAIEAETSLAEIAGYEDKARGAARAAVVWAALHKYQRSRELAASCHLPTERVLACSAILRDYLSTSRPDLREAVAAIPKGEI